MKNEEYKNDNYGAVYPVREGRPFPVQIPLLPDELWYSYLLRLSRFLGFRLFRRFLELHVEPIDNEKWRAYVLPGYDCDRRGLDLGFNMSDGVFEKSSLYTGLSPFLSRNGADRYIYGFSSGLHGRSSLEAKTHGLLLELRRCPECWKSDKLEFGSPYFHREHNMPGYSVCRIHGCALERYIGKRGFELTEDSFAKVDELPFAKDVSEMAAGLLRKPLDCCISDIKKAMNSRFQELYGRTISNKSIAFEDSCGLNSYGQINNRNRVNSSGFTSIKKMLAFSTFLFHDVDTLSSYIKKESLREKFDRTLEVSGYKMVSSYSDNLAILECPTCKKEFLFTPHALITGLRCPFHEKSISGKGLFNNRVSRIAGNDYKLASSFTSLSGQIQMVNKVTGEKISLRADSILEAGEVKDRKNPSSRKAPKAKLSSAKLSKEKHSSEKRNRPPQMAISEEKIRSEVEDSGEFRLLDCSRVTDQWRLKIEHPACGGTFSINRNNFLISHTCRCCNPRGTNIRKLERRIREASGGRFSLIGGYGNNSSIVAEDSLTGQRIKGKTDSVLRRIRTATDGEKSRMEVLDISNKVNARIKGFGEEIMFLEDFSDLCAEKGLSTRFERLCRKGTLRRLDVSTFCLDSSGEHSIEDIVRAKYVMRHGERFGVHVGNSFLRCIGLDPGDSGVISFVSRRTDRSHLNTERIVCGKRVLLHMSDIVINEKNWKPLNILFFLKFSDDVDGVSEEDANKALARWIKENSLEKADFYSYLKLFKTPVRKRLDRILKIKEKNSVLEICQ